MREFQERRVVYRLMHSRVVLFLLILAIVFLLKTVFGIYLKFKDSRVHRYAAQNELTELKRRADSLSKEVKRLGTEKGIEEEIRRQFSMVKDGEGVAIIVDDQLEDQVPGAGEGGGFWRMVKGWFGLE